MIDLLFTSFNRLAFTQASFAALVENTDWSLVRMLHICDDRSSDGTAEWLKLAAPTAPVLRTVVSSRFKGPVAAMQHTIRRCNADMLCKVDNDVIVAPGWLNALTDVMEASRSLGVLGFEPGFGDPVEPTDVAHGWFPAPHVGGLALIRMTIFNGGRRPRPNGKFGGWTEFQRRHGFQCGWITPDLPCFLLDHLPFEPWRSLAAEYVAHGWSRPWPAYPLEMHAYWDWWTRAQVPA